MEKDLKKKTIVFIAKGPFSHDGYVAVQKDNIFFNVDYNNCFDLDVDVTFSNKWHAKRDCIVKVLKGNIDEIYLNPDEWWVLGTCGDTIEQVSKEALHLEKELLTKVPSVDDFTYNLVHKIDIKLLRNLFAA